MPYHTTSGKINLKIKLINQKIIYTDIRILVGN